MKIRLLINMTLDNGTDGKAGSVVSVKKAFGRWAVQIGRAELVEESNDQDDEETEEEEAFLTTKTKRGK